MKKLIAIFILLMPVAFAFAQTKTDSIEIRKTLGTTFRQNGKNLTPGKMLTIMEPNPDAYKEMKIAKENYTWSAVLGWPGGFLVGWPIGTAIGGGEPNWTLAIIGAGLIVASIPLSVAYTKHAKNAVRIYNDGLKQTGRTNLDLKLGFTGNGIGIKLRW